MGEMRHAEQTAIKPALASNGQELHEQSVTSNAYNSTELPKEQVDSCTASTAGPQESY